MTIISVIVPVYNVEAYLKQCIDSIIDQTYKDIEIILIDDGSTDGCGKICDSYTDPRIKVFHTVNRGLSAARNLGIEYANGEYIYFVDSDDWIEKNVLEQAILHIGSADILCFSETLLGIYTGIEAFNALIRDEIDGHTWSMFFQKDCFSSIRFPEGRIAEDIATSYRLLLQAQSVICMETRGYHYRHREGSISNTHNMKNIQDHFLAVTERYDYCVDFFSNHKHQMDERVRTNLKQAVAISIARAWAWRNEYHLSRSREFEDMSYLARNMFSDSERKSFSLLVQGGLFLACFNNPLSFWLANKLHVVTKPTNRGNMNKMGRSYDGIYNRYIKRVIGLIVALPFLIIALPIYLLISIAIVSEDGRPVFYRPLRGGYKGKSFRIFKFRTMVKNADKIGGGTTANHDPRITKVGGFLRKTKLDETANLINILIGTMSFIGPRPELLQYTEKYEGDETKILEVRPGVTDYSSIEFINLDEIVGSGNADEMYEKYVLKKKNALRVKYAETVSFSNDCRIFFITIWKVFQKAFRFIVKKEHR